MTAEYTHLVEQIYAPLRSRAERLGILDADDPDDTPLPLVDVARCDHRPSRGRKRSIGTYYRWMRDGLKYAQIGMSRRVSLIALAEHYARATLASRGETPPDPTSSRTPAARQRALAHANREADALGI